jgi:branched-chain amino acid transport system ATP-binding protein
MNIGGEDPGALLGLFNYEDEAGSPVLAVDGLDVRYGGVLALGDVSLQVKFHETVAVVGPNRAGKSTLLNAISGLAKDRSRGSIMIQGRQILGKGALHVARAGVGRTFQDPPLIDTETVLQNVLLGQHLRMGYRTLDQLVRPWKVNRVERAAREQCVGLLEFFGLGDVKDTLAGQLPYGTRKLIDIVRAVCGPRLLLLDEPTSGLDLDEQTALSASLRALHSSTPISILIVEHHMDVVRAVADSVVGLEGGSVVTTGSASQVLDSEVFRAALIGTRPADASDVSVSLEAQKETSWHSS